MDIGDEVVRVVGNLIAVFVSIIYFFVLLGIVFASNIFSANFYTDILNDIELSEIKLSDIGISATDGASTVQDLLVGSLEEVGINKNDALEIINDEKFNEVVGTFISDSMLYIVNNENIPQIKYDDVEQLIKNEDISNVLTEVPNDKQLREMVNELNAMITNLFEGEISNDQ